MDEGRARRFSVFAVSVLIGIALVFIYLGSREDYRRRLKDTVSSATNTVGSAVESATTEVQEHAPGFYPVVSFADGDTIAVDMDGRKETVRLIGVDTPETHDPRKAVQCFGAQASAFTKALIGGDAVRLEADPTNSNRDKYGRLLRYVFLPDGRLVNAEIIKQGYGFAYILFPFEKMAEFQGYEREARQSGNGLWGGCSVTKDGDAQKTNEAM